MDGSHPIRITQEGDHQVVHLPRDIAVASDSVIRQEGNRLIIEPARKMTSANDFIEFLKTLEPLDEEFGEIEDFPPRPFSF